MAVKKIKDVDKSIEYSLVLTLELDFNSKEEKIFNECTDSIVKHNPKKFCLKNLQKYSKFALWNMKEFKNMCAAASTQVTLDCGDGQCQACANIIGFVFTRYATYID